MGYEVIGKNLRRLRIDKGLTQKQLAENAGLSRVGYRNIETGKSAPKIETIHALADALQIPMQELVARANEVQQVRFRSSGRLRSRDQILAQVGMKLADVKELEEALDDVQRFKISGIADRAVKSGENQAIAAAKAVRKAFGLRKNEPIRDICGLLESNGVKVFSICRASDGFFGLSVGPDDGGPAIVVNTWGRISVERWIFSAAHELGHLVLHLHAFDVLESSEDRQQEKEADIFASHFLMPDEVFRREWSDTHGLPFVDRVLKTKRMFRISYKTVLYRLAAEVPDVNVWRLFQSAYLRRFGRTLGRTDEPLGLDASDYYAGAPASRTADEPIGLAEADFLTDRLWSLVRRGIEGGHISLSKGAKILGVSLEDLRETTRGWVESL